MIRCHTKSALTALALFLGLLLNPAQPAFAFWGLLGKAGSAVGKAGGAAGKTAAGAAGKGAAAGVGAEGVAASGLLDDAARGTTKLGTAEVATAHAALPPEVAKYLSKPASTLSATDTADMMSMYQKMVQQAGTTGDFTVIERLPSTAGQGKTVSNSNTSAQPAMKAYAEPIELPAHAIQLLLHASKAGSHAANAEKNKRCTAFRRQGAVPAAWKTACA